MSYAPHIRRIAAAMIDGAIVSLIGIGISYSLGTNPFADPNTNSMTTIDKILTIVMSAFYLIGFWVAQNGQTPGKRMMNLRIVREDGKPIDVFTGIIRYFGSWVSVAVLDLGYVWILFDGRHQGWHDKLARTVVVESDEKNPHGCAVAMGCLLPIILFGIVGALGSVTTNKERIINLIGNRTKSQSFTNAIKSMKPEAKAHYDVSTDLVKQIGQTKDNQSKIIELNNKNITELRQAIEIEPTNAVLWGALASAYTWSTTNGTIQDGIDAANKALEFDPDNTNTYTKLGNLLNRLQRYDEAVLALQKAIRIDDKNSMAHLWLARSYADLSVYETAKTEYKKAIDLLTEANTSGENDQLILMLQKESAALPK